MIVFDTHVLVWAISDERKLGRTIRSPLERLWGEGRVATARHRDYIRPFQGTSLCSVQRISMSNR